MPIDEELLTSHRRFQSPEAGISEEFLQPTLGLGRTVAVLSRPLGEAHRVGWVINHSFAMEQFHLSRLETLVARAVSAAGFPVLRFHGQGYGDSEGRIEGPSLDSHLAEAGDAVDLMMESGDVDRVGVLGAKFGGMIAGLIAEQKQLPFLGLWEPTINGRQYVRDLLRARVFSEMVLPAQSGESADVGELKRELASNGRVDIKGFLLTQAAHEEISTAELLTSLTEFKGSSLVVGISRTGRPGLGVTKLVERLRELGGDTTLEMIQDPLAAQFGQFHFKTVDGGRGKVDTQLELSHSIADITARWVLQKSGVGLATAEAR